MSSITYIISSSNAKSLIPAFKQGQANKSTTVKAAGVISPGRIQMRLLMRSTWSAHSIFPCFPVSLPLGKGEAGSYPLPALKLGKLNFSYTPG